MLYVYVPPQFAPKSKSWAKSDTKLWAGIASFRDYRCGQTLFNMFSKAEHPERITAGVVQQNEEGDESCLLSYCRLMEEKVCTARVRGLMVQWQAFAVVQQYGYVRVFVL